ncbi:MAG: hypothetical protein ACLRSA_06195 [Streptococcus salivarius]
MSLPVSNPIFLVLAVLLVAVKSWNNPICPAVARGSTPLAGIVQEVQLSTDLAPDAISTYGVRRSFFVKEKSLYSIDQLVEGDLTAWLSSW